MSGAGDPSEGGRYDVTEVMNAAGRVVATYRTCLHLTPEPVTSGGVVVARLCVDCGAQLPTPYTLGP